MNKHILWEIAYIAGVFLSASLAFLSIYRLATGESVFTNLWSFCIGAVLVIANARWARAERHAAQAAQAQQGGAA